MYRVGLNIIMQLTTPPITGLTVSGLLFLAGFVLWVDLDLLRILILMWLSVLQRIQGALLELFHGCLCVHVVLNTGSTGVLKRKQALQYTMEEASSLPLCSTRPLDMSAPYSTKCTNSYVAKVCISWSTINWSTISALRCALIGVPQNLEARPWHFYLLA